MLKKILSLGLFGLAISTKAHPDEVDKLANRLDQIMKEEKIVTLKFGQNDNIIDNIQQNPEIITLTRKILKRLQSKYVLEQASDSITLRIHDEDQEIDFSFINEHVITIDLDSHDSHQPPNGSGGGIGN